MTSGPSRNWYTATCPEHATEVLEHRTGLKQIEEFAHWFSRKYFQLSENIIDSFEEQEINRDAKDPSVWKSLLATVPVELNAIEYEGLDELWEHYDGPVPHLALLAGWDDMYGGGIDSVHTSWVETALASSVPPEIIRRIPEKGIHPAVLREALTGTKEEDAMHLIEWVGRETGNMFMDYSNDEFLNGYIYTEWDEECIAQLTEEWKEAQKIEAAIGRTINRMRDDPVTGLAQVLDFTLARMECMDVENVIKKWNPRYIDMNSNRPEGDLEDDPEEQPDPDHGAQEEDDDDHDDDR